MGQRKRRTAAFKAKVALEAIRGGGRKQPASWLGRIELKPSDHTGVMVLNEPAHYFHKQHLYKEHDRPEKGRSCVNVVAGVGFDTDSPSSWEWEEIELEPLATATA